MILSPTKDKNSLLKDLSIFEQYIKGDLNDINDLNPSCNNSHFQEIEKKILDIASHLKKRDLESLTVYGEIMLACEKLSDGFTDDKISAKCDDPKLNYISKTLNTMFSKLDNSINDIVKVLDEYGEQNYLNSIDETQFRGGQFQNLLIGITKLKDKITSDLCSSYRESMVLEHESQVLKMKADALSASTQRQSVAIEETAAAVVEITANITSNTTTAEKMLNFGHMVQNSSKKGEQLSNDTYDAMEDINSSTNKVYDAISIISQIAFQTNILSLNAAVEAATAGEAGKGFAVVAQEVRNLASRSADAAKEIGDLMDELKAKANHGKNIANDMKDDYQSLAKNINQTVDLIDTIVTSSKEQTLGIAQVEDALNSIDIAVQENSSVSDDVSTIATQTHNVAINILNTANKAQFHGKDKIEIRENSLLRRDNGSNKTMRK